MKTLSKKMDDSLDGSEVRQMQEDIQVLRQVLDNLLAFSIGGSSNERGETLILVPFNKRNIKSSKICVYNLYR
jgi:hypothetical protein